MDQWVPRARRMAPSHWQTVPDSIRLSTRPNRSSACWTTRSAAARYTPEDYAAITAVNLAGYFHITQHAIRPMVNPVALSEPSRWRIGTEVASQGDVGQSSRL